jgi:hypothetical protein
VALGLVDLLRLPAVGSDATVAFPAVGPWPSAVLRSG